MGLKRVNLLDIDEEANSYFHFTDESHLYDTEQGVGIINRGISSIPRDRPHTVGKDKEKPCIYFVQGYGGILELMDVWVRFEYSELALKENYPPGYENVDVNLMKKAYDKLYDKLKNAKYLKLELKPGDNLETSDFNPMEKDFKKEEHFRQSIYHEEGAVDDQFYKWNYGMNTDYSVATMDRWNMNTHLNYEGEKVIPPEKIRIIQDSEGKTDALSVIMEIYQKYRETVQNVNDLDGFIQYVIEREHRKELLEKGTIDDDFVENKFIEISKKILSRDNQADFSFILHGVCGMDLSETDMSNLTEDNFRRLTFDSETKFPEDKALMPSFIKELIEQGKYNSFSEYANSLIEQGKDFSNMEQIHTQEIDGRGTTIGLIDGCFDSSAKEFEGRVKRHLVFKEVDGEIVCEDYEKKDGDNYHGKTTASLAVGEECGVAPKADMYLFGIAEGTDWTKAKEAILKYIIDNNIELDIISMSADKQNIGKASEYIEMLEKNGCTIFDSKKYWMNFVWGRLDNNGEALLDHLMQTMMDTDMQYDENDRKIINNIPNNIVLPCTQRTSFSQSDRDGKQTYKYNGSFCGASFAIPQIAGLFLLARQVDKSISFDSFIEIVRDTAKINKDNMKYLDADGIITKVIEMEKRKKILEIGIATGDSKKVMQYASAGARAGAKLGTSLEGAYSGRNTRRGQVQDASRSVRETNRNRENPEIEKEGQEYDE